MNERRNERTVKLQWISFSLNIFLLYFLLRQPTTAPPHTFAEIRSLVHRDSVFQRVGDALRLLVARHPLGVRVLDGDRGLPGAHSQDV